eukprot:Selendium_serpulae@DN4503_c0_g1_i1.p2
MMINFNPDAPGRPVNAKNETFVLNRVRTLCGWKHQTFPGSQPVSLSRDNLNEIHRSHYVACEKSDGVRYMMFAFQNRVFFIDRKEKVSCLQQRLPVSQDETLNHQDTLLDGELVTDEVTSTDGVKTQVTRFLVYDSV